MVSLENLNLFVCLCNVTDCSRDTELLPGYRRFLRHTGIIDRDAYRVGKDNGFHPVDDLDVAVVDLLVVEVLIVVDFPDLCPGIVLRVAKERAAVLVVDEVVYRKELRLCLSGCSILPETDFRETGQRLPVRDGTAQIRLTLLELGKHCRECSGNPKKKLLEEVHGVKIEYAFRAGEVDLVDELCLTSVYAGGDGVILHMLDVAVAKVDIKTARELLRPVLVWVRVVVGRGSVTIDEVFPGCERRSCVSVALLIPCRVDELGALDYTLVRLGCRQLLNIPCDHWCVRQLLPYLREADRTVGIQDVIASCDGDLVLEIRGAVRKVVNDLLRLERLIPCTDTVQDHLAVVGTEYDLGRVVLNPFGGLVFKDPDAYAIQVDVCEVTPSVEIRR